jgi:hypothetical protein
MTRHETLLREYAKELRVAKRRAETWWAESAKAIRAQTGDKKTADAVLRNRWPDGPASHPWVLAVIRKYWLACEALNEKIAAEQADEDETSEREYAIDTGEEEDEDENERAAEEDEEVYPHIFILEWLMTNEFDDLADFLGSLSFWPIGLDREDRYT